MKGKKCLFSNGSFQTIVAIAEHSIRTGSDLFLKVVKKPWIIKKGKSLKNFAHTNELKDVGGRNAAAFFLAFKHSRLEIEKK